MISNNLGLNTLLDLGKYFPPSVDMKIKFFKKFLPDIKEEEIEDYIAVFPKSMEETIPHQAWLYFDEHCDKAIAFKIDIFKLARIDSKNKEDFKNSKEYQRNYDTIVNNKY